MENPEIVGAFSAVLPVNSDSEEKNSGIVRDFSVPGFEFENCPVASTSPFRP